TSPTPAPAAPCPRKRRQGAGLHAGPRARRRVLLSDLLAQALSGLSYGVLLFLLSVGLTLIFGMLDVVNLAHGSFYMLGAYAGLALIAAPGSFWIALIVAPLAVAVVGTLVERLCLGPLY